MLKLSTQTQQKLLYYIPGTYHSCVIYPGTSVARFLHIPGGWWFLVVPGNRSHASMLAIIKFFAATPYQVPGTPGTLYEYALTLYNFTGSKQRSSKSMIFESYQVHHGVSSALFVFRVLLCSV